MAMKWLTFLVVYFALLGVSLVETASFHKSGRVDAFIGLHDVGTNISPKQYEEISRAGVSIVRSNSAVWNMVEKKKGHFDFNTANYTYS